MLKSFDELTSQEKLDILDRYILEMIIRNAKAQLENEMIDIIMREAQQEILTEIARKFL